jgi:hypothetical protein
MPSFGKSPQRYYCDWKKDSWRGGIGAIRHVQVVVCGRLEVEWRLRGGYGQMDFREHKSCEMHCFGLLTIIGIISLFRIK